MPATRPSGARPSSDDVVTTVLVVDDESIVREVVVRYFEREGHKTLEAGDGDLARALVDASRRASSCST